MNYELIKAAVAAVIKENGNEEITGNLLQQVLHSIINILGVGYQYMGMATPSTAPDTPDARQFYFAVQEGAYSNFNTSPITELDGRELAIFYYDTAWHVVMTGIATRNAMGGYAFYGESLASGSVITGVDENTFFLVGPGTYTINGYSTTISTPGISALMYDVSNDELIDYTLFPYDTAPTAGSTRPVTSGGVKTALDGKIDKVPDALTGEIPVFDGDGGLEGSNKLLSDIATKEDIAVLAGEAGLAEAVIDTDGAGTEQQLTFRKSGGDGGAYYRKIKGKTIAWNQLVNPANFRASESSFTNGVKYVNNGDGSYSIIVDTGGATADRQIEVSTISTPSTAKRLYVLHNDKALSGSTIFFSTGYSSLTQDTIIPVGTSAVYNSIVVKSGCPAGTYTFAPQIYNLTLSGIADEISTPADFKALYPGIYPHNPGTLKSNDAEAVETTGANQWDEEWELGVYSQQNGNPVDNSNRIRSKNYIPTLSTSMYVTTGTYQLVILQYDESYNYLGENNVRTVSTPGAALVLLPACRYIRFYIGNNGTTYNHDICINLSNAAINGQYFPYWKRTLQLGLTTRKDTDGNVPFADGMKGAGTAADWADKVGGEVVMGEVDLGSLAWTRTDYSGRYVFVSQLAHNKGMNAIISDGAYTFSSETAAKNCPDMGIMLNANSSTIYIANDSISTAADFKTAMQGVYLDFELATPVPFTWAEPLNLGVKVDENGTERAVAPEGATAPSAPFVADTTYTMSVARIVAKLNSI